MGSWVLQCMLVVEGRRAGLVLSPATLFLPSYLGTLSKTCASVAMIITTKPCVLVCCLPLGACCVYNRYNVCTCLCGCARVAVAMSPKPRDDLFQNGVYPVGVAVLVCCRCEPCSCSGVR